MAGPAPSRHTEADACCQLGLAERILWARHWVAARQGKVRRMRPSPFNKGSGAAKHSAAAVKPGAAAAAPQRMVTLSEADDSGEVGLCGPASLDHYPTVALHDLRAKGTEAAPGPLPSAELGASGRCVHD